MGVFEKKKKKENLEINKYIKTAMKARRWIDRNTIQNKGIVITSKQRIIYQEVSGYYIPTLLQWGMRDRAIAYAEYLCDIQEDNGAWLDGTQSRCSVFNTAQVLRGLYEVVDIYPRVYTHLINGCEWLLSNMNEEGRLVATEGTEWSGLGFNSELIHLYCLPPLCCVANKYGKKEYMDAVDKIKNFYLRAYKDDVENFNYLSHFYAYILEALVDLGEIKIVRNAMNKVQKLQRKNGAVPALKDCNWVCSTGLFQLAIVWFKLGDWEHGNRAFDYAVSLQNKSGGWYGGYPTIRRFGNSRQLHYSQKENINYFPDEEISWAVKYFFDALYYRQKSEFEMKAHSFISYIDSEDEKYKAVYRELKRLQKGNKVLRVADIGCGKGRYLKKMQISNPEHQYYGIDLSKTVLQYIKNPNISVSTGSILRTGCADSEFDLVFASESVEHAIFIDLGIKEMCRITKSGGSVVIIDKDNKFFESMEYRDWILPEELSTKQWLDMKEIGRIYKENGLTDIEIFDVDSEEGVLYRAAIGRKA